MRRTTSLILASIAAVLLVALPVTYLSGVFVYHYWTRDHPLVNPLAVSRVENSTLFLANGISQTLDTIQPAAGVTQADLDAFLSVATEQGVVFEGESVIAEPKFYNWCGTINGPRKWEGTYCQARLDEAAILCGYAVPVESTDPAEAYGDWRRSVMLQLRQDWYEGLPPERFIAGHGIGYALQPRTLESSDEDLEYYTSTTRPD